MRHVIMRALHVCAVAAVLTIAGHAQTAAPQTETAAPNTPNTIAPLDDVRRQLQEQREEIERLRATVQEQSQLLQELLTRERSAQASPAAAVESAAYKTGDVATTDTLDGTPNTNRTRARTRAGAPHPG